jgi:hypothetical protein
VRGTEGGPGPFVRRSGFYAEGTRTDLSGVRELGRWRNLPGNPIQSHRRLDTRVVQRSLHDPQREHCINSSDSDAIAPVAHVVHAVEAEDIGGEGSQASEDAGVAADPTVVLAEADIADIVQPVLDPPMAADGVGAGCGGEGNVGNEVGDLAGSLPQAGHGDALERIAGDADDRRDVIGPFGVGQGGAGSKHLDHADFIA